ncbi:MAG TPA: YnbE family lipoprotein [Novosphingobium sp.]|nr:YnbE family lipoprotein [Novosphingobium sp.]
MKSCELTGSVPAATSLAMTGRGQVEVQQGVSRSGWRAACAAMMVLSAAALGGCINVAAPDKPIVIELNINIRQEVIYRLAADAANTIDENPEIF